MRRTSQKDSNLDACTQEICDLGQRNKVADVSCKDESSLPPLLLTDMATYAVLLVQNLWIFEITFDLYKA